jgi:hypothetical protein
MQITCCHHHDVGKLLPQDSTIRVSSQDSHQQKTQGLTNISQHKNSTIQINITVVRWVKKHKQYK